MLTAHYMCAFFKFFTGVLDGVKNVPYVTLFKKVTVAKKTVIDRYRMLSQIALNKGKTLKANDLTETVRLGLDFTTSLGGTLLPQKKEE